MDNSLSPRDEDLKERILALKIGEELTFNWFEEGGALVTRTENNVWKLEEIPQYGGMSISEDFYDNMAIRELIQLGNSWT